LLAASAADIANRTRSTAVLEYGPTETPPLLGVMLLGFARLCRHCRPARPAQWRKTRVFPGTEAKSGERRTVCWRGLDSNFQYAGAVNLVVAPFVRRVRIVLVIVFSLAMA